MPKHLISCLFIIFSSSVAAEDLLSGNQVFQGFSVQQEPDSITLRGYEPIYPWLDDRPIHPFLLENDGVFDLYDPPDSFSCPACPTCRVFCVPEDLQELQGGEISRWMEVTIDPPILEMKKCTTHRICYKHPTLGELCYEYEQCTEDGDQITFGPMNQFPLLEFE